MLQKQGGNRVRARVRDAGIIFLAKVRNLFIVVAQDFAISKWTPHSLSIAQSSFLLTPLKNEEEAVKKLKEVSALVSSVSPSTNRADSREKIEILFWVFPCRLLTKMKSHIFWTSWSYVSASSLCGRASNPHPTTSRWQSWPQLRPTSFRYATIYSFFFTIYLRQRIA